MESQSFHVRFLVLFFCSNLALIRSKFIQNSLNNEERLGLYIFGDSIFDVGNNNYLKNPIGLANFTPYGETFFHRPTGRFCNGRLIVDFIAEYLKLPLIQPYLQPGKHDFVKGVNFASGGAGALVETHEGDKGRVVYLNNQVVQMKKVKEELKKQIGDEETNKLLSKSIYMISIGINDYLGRSSVFKSFTQQEYEAMILGNLTSAIKDIYEIGGRKFGLMGLGALDCSPTIRSLERNNGSCDKQVFPIIKSHNEVLLKLLNQMQTQLKDFNYLLFDFYTALIQRVQNPLKYGFKEVKSACCGAGPYRGIPSGCGLVKGYKVCEDVSEYLFFDDVHPTEKAYQQFAKIIWSGSTDLIAPYNLKTLVFDR